MSRTYIRNLSSFGYKTPQNSSKGREISGQTGQYTSIESLFFWKETISEETLNVGVIYIYIYIYIYI